MKKTINEAVDEILPHFSIFALVIFIASQLWLKFLFLEVYIKISNKHVIKFYSEID